MARHMRAAMEAAGLRGTADFLDCFKGYGWYLDDLVLTPINRLTRAQRREEHRASRQSLARRIAEYRPLAIVSLLLDIRDIVDAAAVDAASNAPRYAVPFPGMGQQGRFRAGIARILPLLPRA